MKERAPYVMWSLPTTFRRDGWPIMGTAGADVKDVVVMELETFKRLIRENPELATAQFRMGMVQERRQ